MKRKLTAAEAEAVVDVEIRAREIILEALAGELGGRNDKLLVALISWAYGQGWSDCKAEVIA